LVFKPGGQTQPTSNGGCSPLIRELESRGITAFVPPKESSSHGRFTTPDFEFSEDEPEYEILRQRKLTEEYAAVKAEPPRVERRLGELVNRHGHRRARYRGLVRVQVQKLIEGTVHNLNRMLRLLEGKTGFAIV